MRPIDADMAIDAIQKDRETSWKELENDDAEYRNGCDDGYAYSMQIISELPSVERKKGKWIKMSDADGIYWACSECGEDIPRVPHYNPQFDLFPRLESIEKTNFCPNCGASMKGE